jgi:hypothetical protein
MELLPPAPSVVVGATVVKRFPGYGEHRGSILQIDGGKVVVHWAATDERTTLTLKEAAKRVVAAPHEDDDDDQSVTSAAFGIESSATSFTAPRHVLLELDDEEDLRSLDGDTTIAYDSGDETAPYLGEGGTRTTSSRFWGVSWHRQGKKWKAQYSDADGKMRSVGLFGDEEEAARAVNKAIRDAGLEGRRKTNAIDAKGALVPRERTMRDRAAIVAPDPSRAPSATTSKFWGVNWHKSNGRWHARYADANGKRRSIGYFDTQEAAAHAVNAAIRRAGLEGRRKTNPVVDGQLVPRARPAAGHGPRYKRRREESAAAAPSTDTELALRAELERLKAENRELKRRRR